MTRFFYPSVLFSSLILFSSCGKGSDVDVVEMSFPETAEIYLLNNLDPGFVYPEELQYMSSREVKGSVCLDINAHIDVSITRPSVPAIVDPSNPALHLTHRLLRTMMEVLISLCVPILVILNK